MATEAKDNLLVRMSGFFFKKWRLTLFLWSAILVFGGLSYTNLIKREGFPPIQFPLSIVSGTYFVDDATIVDREIGKPLSEKIVALDTVDTVQTTAGNNFFSAVVFFNSDVSPVSGTEQLRASVDELNLPSQAQFDFQTIDPSGFLNEYDMLLSVYSTEKTDIATLEKAADYVADELTAFEEVTLAEKQSLLESGVNPATGENETRQTSFNQIGLRDSNGDLNFYESVTIGLDRDQQRIDILELSEFVNSQIEQIDVQQFGDGFHIEIGADYADSINSQVSSLQSNLLTGLLAVALVSFLLITWRASIITGLFMVTVVLTTIAILYLIGYSLNTITLFALVLSLGLFVDDATIVVESIDASRKKSRKKPREVARGAVKRIAAASFAGTFTTVLVFLPLAFVSGILGEFIRLMPITIIIALVSSLVLSLTVIPFLSRFLLLRHNRESWVTKNNPIAKLEEWVGDAAGNLPLLLRKAPKKGRIVATSMVIISIICVVVGGSFASRLSFNIFPPTKDSDQIGFQVSYPEGYSIEQAEVVADQLNKLVVEEVGNDAQRVLYGSFQQPNARNADALIELTPFNEREVKSPEYIERLETRIDQDIDDSISVRVLQFDAGPPVEEFPFKVQIFDEDFDRANQLADEVVAHLENATITRQNGTEAQIVAVKPPAQQSINRTDGKRTLTVQAAFNDDDISALLVSAEQFVKDKFTPEYLSSNGYSEDALGFDFGQESDNAESFAALGVVFPIALLAMYILLSVQFKSLLQPLLIFIAIPFTFLGVFSGLYATDNAFSFFVQVGLIGLIGIAVNNTILLTDYANQERRAGLRSIEAISEATRKRFRPLLTTTLTTVVALLPLALSDPFWEALAFTIIFGLLSSTMLVILAFPYYYLGAEWLRMRFSRDTRKARNAEKIYETKSKEK